MSKPRNQSNPGRALTACALGYQRGSGRSPQISAKGYGANAKEIFSLARRYGIPIRQDNSLAESLSSLQLCEEIPEDHFEQVARLFVDVGILK